MDETGGHKHSADRDLHTGLLDKTTISFDAGDTGPVDVLYVSNEVAGVEKIRYRILDIIYPGDWNDLAEVVVEVPDLEPTFESEYCRLTGSDGTPHPSNHHATEGTKDNTAQICQDYYDLTKTTLGINDMSLIWGGVFDISGKWNTPHKTHREGLDVDIDRRVWNAMEKEYVYKACDEDTILRRVVDENNGSLLCECVGGTTTKCDNKPFKHVDF